MYLKMWNEILKRIDGNNTPQRAIKPWDGAVSSIKLISDGINLVYRFERNSDVYYLRITHAELRSEQELLAAITYQRHLFEHDVPVCEPIASMNGLWVECIRQGNELFLAHVCREVPGNPIHFDYSNLELYKHWGTVLGKLHQAAQKYIVGKYNYTNWNKSLEELHEYAPNESEALQNTLAEVTHFLNSRLQSRDCYGLTHGDHREGNVLTDGHQVHIIDFDLPSMNWFTEDVTRPFFDSIVHDKRNWQDKFKPYLEGYFSVMPANSLDLPALPKQIQMKCLEIYLWTKNNWNAETAPGGNDTAKWLNLIYQKITEPSWAKQLSF